MNSLVKCPHCKEQLDSLDYKLVQANGAIFGDPNGFTRKAQAWIAACPNCHAAIATQLDPADSTNFIVNTVVNEIDRRLGPPKAV